MSNIINYLIIKRNKLLMKLVIFGAINLGASVFGLNLFELFNQTITKITGKDLHIDKIIYVIIGIAALKLAFRRTTFTPYLGDTAFPSQVFVNTRENKIGTMNVPVYVTPNTRVAYWGTLPRTTDYIPHYTEAYGDFSNSGVVVSDDKGLVNLSILPGTSYLVNSGEEYPRDIHYRELDLGFDTIGKLKTIYY
jgi:uncharacterized membrane protein YuzA (DUF378 family)